MTYSTRRPLGFGTQSVGYRRVKHRLVKRLQQSKSFYTEKLSKPADSSTISDCKIRVGNHYGYFKDNVYHKTIRPTPGMLMKYVIRLKTRCAPGSASTMAEHLQHTTLRFLVPTVFRIALRWEPVTCFSFQVGGEFCSTFVLDHMKDSLDTLLFSVIHYFNLLNMWTLRRKASSLAKGPRSPPPPPPPTPAQKELVRGLAGTDIEMLLFF